MDLRTYFDTNKEKMFPFVKDWKDPQDWIRKNPDVNKLTWAQWFFFHPSSYKLIIFSSLIISLFVFGSLSYYMFVKHVWFLVGIFSLMVVLLIKGLVKKFKESRISPDTTFFDIWMREY